MSDSDGPREDAAFFACLASTGRLNPEHDGAVRRNSRGEVLLERTFVALVPEIASIRQSVNPSIQSHTTLAQEPSEWLEVFDVVADGFHHHHHRYGQQ